MQYEYPDFDPEAAAALATDLGKLAALCPIEDVNALLTSFVAKEEPWREHVMSRGLGGGPYDEHCWPYGSLDQHYAVTMLGEWARASGFPALASSDDCAKLAATLADWPLPFRKAASFMVLGWLEGGSFGGDGAKKLMTAIVHGGGAKPAAKPKKK